MEQYLFEDEIGKIHRYVNIHFRDETPVMDLLRKWEHAGGISIGILTSRIQRLIETERNRTEHGIGKILPVSLYRDEIRELTELGTQICRLIEVNIRDAEIPKKAGWPDAGSGFGTATEQNLPPGAEMCV